MRKKLSMLMLVGLLVLAMGTSAFAVSESSSSYSGSMMAGSSAQLGNPVQLAVTPKSMRDANVYAYYDTYNGSVAYQSWATTSNGVQASYILSGFTGATKDTPIYSGHQVASTVFRYRAKSTGGNSGEQFHISGRFYISSAEANQ